MAKIQSGNALMGASSCESLYQIACAKLIGRINSPSFIIKKITGKIILSVTAVTFVINYLFTTVSIGGAK